MTEITVENDKLKPHPVNLLWFVISLIGAPIIVAIFTFWVYFIPVAAVVLGGPSYLLFGTPALWVAVRRHDADPPRTAAFAFFANLVSFLPVLAYCHFVLNEPGYALFIVGFGCFFAPIWGFVFGMLYQAWALPWQEQSNE